MITSPPPLFFGGKSVVFSLHEDRRELQAARRGKVQLRLVCSHLRMRTRRGEKPNTEMTEK